MRTDVMCEVDTGGRVCRNSVRYRMCDEIGTRGCSRSIGSRGAGLATSKKWLGGGQRTRCCASASASASAVAVVQGPMIVPVIGRVAGGQRRNGIGIPGSQLRCGGGRGARGAWRARVGRRARGRRRRVTRGRWLWRNGSPAATRAQWRWRIRSASGGRCARRGAGRRARCGCRRGWSKCGAFARGDSRNDAEGAEVWQ